MCASTIEIQVGWSGNIVDSGRAKDHVLPILSSVESSPLLQSSFDHCRCQNHGGQRLFALPSRWRGEREGLLDSEVQAILGADEVTGDELANTFDGLLGPSSGML